MERSGPYIWIYCQQHLIRTTLNVFTWGMGGGGGVHPLLHLWGKLYISLLKTSMSAPSVFLSCKKTLLWLKEINAYRHALTHQGTVKLYTHTHTHFGSSVQKHPAHMAWPLQHWITTGGLTQLHTHTHTRKKIFQIAAPTSAQPQIINLFFFTTKTLHEFRNNISFSLAVLFCL